MTAATDPALPAIMGNAEVAEALGCSPTNLDAQVGLPEPKWKLRQGRVWLASEIIEFAEARKVRATS